MDAAEQGRVSVLSDASVILYQAGFGLVVRAGIPDFLRKYNRSQAPFRHALIRVQVDAKGDKSFIDKLAAVKGSILLGVEKVYIIWLAVCSLRQTKVCHPLADFTFFRAGQVAVCEGVSHAMKSIQQPSLAEERF